MQEMSSRFPSPEKMKEITKVILEFMRHGKREYGATPEEDANPDLRLTAQGRAQADARGIELRPQPEVAKVLGSPRVRTIETSGRAALAGTGWVEQDDTVEQIVAKLGEQGVSVGGKMRQDPRLNFSDEGPIGPDGKAAYYEKRYMPWMVNDSDKDAIAKGDALSSTFTREASNVADLVLYYARLGDKLNTAVAQGRVDREKFGRFGNQVERYLGTHQGITECFVAKVLALVEGEGAKDAFVKSVGAGFAETEGAHVEIVNEGTAQNILMTYTLKDPDNGDTKRTVRFGKDVLERIMEDRHAFEAKISRSES